MTRSSAKTFIAALRSSATSRAETFARDEDGAMILWSIFTIFGTFLAIGLGLSLQMYENHRAHLQNTLDRAVLAATDLDQTLGATMVIEDYVSRAGLEGALTEADVENGINFRESFASAELAMNTVFVPGQSRWSVDANSAAIESITDVEISLVLDNSGSMGWDDDYRLNLLKPAAKDFITAVSRPIAPGIPGSVAISIVPFSTQVNAGPVLGNKLTFSNQHSYSHCARFAFNDYNDTEIDPDETISRAAHFDIFTWDSPVDTYGVVCPFDSSRHITPWSQNPEYLRNKIESMWAGGNTSMDVATKWGVALLDPTFDDVLEELVDDGVVEENLRGQPFAFGRDNTLKVLVVMSDGQNTDEYRIDSDYRSGNSPVWKNPANGDYSYYHNRSGTSWDYYSIEDGSWKRDPDGGNNAQRLTWPELFDEMSVAYFARYIKEEAIGGNWNTYYNQIYGGVNASSKNTRTSNICKAARDAGIVVYTIGMDTYGQGDTTLEDCAGTITNFFDVSAIEIDEAFSAIAQQINQLRLTQ